MSQQESTRIPPCNRCGGPGICSSPSEDAYYYVSCRDDCGRESVWAHTRDEAVALWQKDPKTRPAEENHADKNKRRLTLDLSVGTCAKITRLRSRTDTASDAAVIRKAIDLYDFLVKESDDARSVVIKNNDGKEREILFL